jgi:hypothetical protein
MGWDEAEGRAFQHVYNAAAVEQSSNSEKSKWQFMRQAKAINAIKQHKRKENNGKTTKEIWKQTLFYTRQARKMWDDGQRLLGLAIISFTRIRWMAMYGCSREPKILCTSSLGRGMTSGSDSKFVSTACTKFIRDFVAQTKSDLGTVSKFRTENLAQPG